MAEVILRFKNPDGILLEGEEAAITLQNIGPTLDAIVEFYTGRSGEPAPTEPRKVEALIDTGASVSCIDETLAQELQLPLIHRRPVSGISGSSEAPMYLAKLTVPSLHRVTVAHVAGVKLAEGGQRHQMLLGREFLQGFRMTYEGRSGIVIIENNSPALPSIIDQGRKITPAKISRSRKIPSRPRRMRT